MSGLFRSLVLVLMISLVAAGQERSASKKRKLLYVASVVAVGVAATLDTHSSWGKVEANPLLRTQGHRFGTSSAGLKLGLTTGNLLMQHFLLRKDERVLSPFTLTNFGVAAAQSSVAWRNYGIRAR
jgi:hypothetical protein